MTEILEGGCICGATRYKTRGRPERTTVCHCTYCQRLTGSAFGIWTVFMRDKVELVGEAPTPYEHRSDESGRRINSMFCARCGTTIGSTLERSPDIFAIASGTFDDRSWIAVDRHIWMRSAQPWVSIPENGARFEKQYISHPS